MAIATSLSIQASQTKVLKGTLENDISGWLKRLDTGANLGYKKIRLYRKKPSEGSLKFYYELGNYGNGLYVFRVGDWNEVGIYQFQTQFQGDAEFSACKSPILKVECYVPTPEAIDTSISIKADPIQGILPLEITISGKLIRKDTGAGIPYKNVYIYYKKPSATVFNLFSLRGTESDGSYRAYPTLIEEGTYKFYAKFLGDETFKACESSTVEVQGVGEKTSTLRIEFAIVPKVVGDRANLNGELMANGSRLGNRKYLICQRKNGGSWQCVTDYTLSDGSIIWQSTPLEAGSYEWQGKFEGYAYVYDSESVKGCVSNILSAVVKEKEEPTPEPTPVVGALYALRCHYYNIVGLGKEYIQGAIETVVVPVVNPIISPLGYDYVKVDALTGYAPQWKAGHYDIVYRARGSPVIPLAVIKPIIIALIAGVVIFWLGWVYLETNRMEYELKMSLDDLLREGYIDKDTYEKLREKAEEDWWDKLMEWLPMLLLVLIVASIAGALRGRD